MAGVKGRSGGPRPNSGGVRAGAGRKPTKTDLGLSQVAPKEVLDAANLPDALIFLAAVMVSDEAPIVQRVKAAQALASFQHAKPGDLGKKEHQKTAAHVAASKFVAAQPPKLAAAGGRKV